MSVSISEIIAGASSHAVPLAGECAGYLVLAAADQAVTAPRRIGPAEVRLFDDGTVRVEGAHAAAETDVEADLRALLDALLLRASSSTPGLLRASRRASGRGIAALVREIETALIPVNRAAAHRALARLERETERARHAGRLDTRALSEVSHRETSRRRSEGPGGGPSVEEPLPAAPAPLHAEKLVEVPALQPTADEADEIPSLFAPPVGPAPSVESIARLAAEIETRPEPVVLRRSAPPPPNPARTPSPPPLPVRARSPEPPSLAFHSPEPPSLAFHSPELPPVALRTPSPPPLPVAPAQSTTPFFGTVVQTHADDEMEIEIVVEESELLEDELTGVLVRSAPLEISAMPGPTTESNEATDPSPPVLEDDAAHGDESRSVSEPSGPESTTLLAEAAEMPAEEPPILLQTAALPPVEALPVQASPIEIPVEPEATSEPPLAEPSEPHGETLALALAIDKVVSEVALPPRLAMPEPRPSNVEDLLDRMTQSSVEGTSDLRATLKGIAGLEPTPPPPET